MATRSDAPPDYLTETGPCDLCHNDPAECSCPECSKCGSAGDELCYKLHGMKWRCESRERPGGIQCVEPSGHKGNHRAMLGTHEPLPPNRPHRAKKAGAKEGGK